VAVRAGEDHAGRIIGKERARRASVGKYLFLHESDGRRGGPVDAPVAYS